jgi:hypothetical protein
MEIKNLCKAYGDLPALENVSFTAGVGVTALWGPSGVGKTTLLRILLGLEKPDSGELMGTAARWSAVFQEDRLLEGLDALGNLRFALGTDYEEAKAAAMLTALGLTWETGKPVGAWSGGMKRRLALARALLAPSEAIALDEPFTGLDDENRQRAIRAIRRAAETKPVILVTHDRTELNLLRANIVNL